MKDLLPTRESNNTFQHEEDFTIKWINAALEAENERGISVEHGLFPSQFSNRVETERSMVILFSVWIYTENYILIWCLVEKLNFGYNIRTSA